MNQDYPYTYHTMSDSSTITCTCIGEILWDALPAGLFLGGAPLNVCLNLHELGNEAAMVSRVGKDRLGKEALRRLERTGLNTDYIQLDEKHETGFVKVELSSEGDPDYEIVQPVAWDFIDITNEKTSELLNKSWAVVFGTLAQRANPSLKALSKLDCLKVLDMNLRSPHYEKNHVLELVGQSDLIKMNEQELALLQDWCSLSRDMEEAAREITTQFMCSSVCVTRGGKGAVLLHNNQWFEHEGYPVKVADAVGAGDAFLAALLYGLKSGRAVHRLLSFANAAGAYVASQSGANPDYSIEDVESVMAGEKSFK